MVRQPISAARIWALGSSRSRGHTANSARAKVFDFGSCWSPTEVAPAQEVEWATLSPAQIASSSYAMKFTSQLPRLEKHSTILTLVTASAVA